MEKDNDRTVLKLLWWYHKLNENRPWRQERNLEKEISPCVPTRNKKKNKKNPKKRKGDIFNNLEDEVSDKDEKAISFSSITAREDLIQLCEWL